MILRSLAVAAFISALAAPVAAQSVIEDFDRFCLAGQGDNAVVLSLAEAAGWRTPPNPVYAPAGGVVLADPDSLSSPRLGQMVVVGIPAPAPDWPTASVCFIEGGDTVEDYAAWLSARLGFDTPRQADGLYNWVFTLGAGGRPAPQPDLLTADGEVVARSARELGPIHSVMLSPEAGGYRLIYSRVTA